jgi:hypothetical protein
MKRHSVLNTSPLAARRTSHERPSTMQEKTMGLRCDKREPQPAQTSETQRARSYPLTI